MTNPGSQATARLFLVLGNTNRALLDFCQFNRSAKYILLLHLIGCLVILGDLRQVGEYTFGLRVYDTQTVLL